VRQASLLDQPHALATDAVWTVLNGYADDLSKVRYIISSPSRLRTCCYAYHGPRLAYRALMSKELSDT